MEATLISALDVMSMQAEGDTLLILDVRADDVGSDRKIPGAILVNAAELKPEWVLTDPMIPIVVYDDTSDEAISGPVAVALSAAGFHADALLGGWHQWIKEGFVTEPRHSEAIAEQAPVARVPVEETARRAVRLVQERVRPGGA